MTGSSSTQGRSRRTSLAGRLALVAAVTLSLVTVGSDTAQARTSSVAAVRCVANIDTYNYINMRCDYAGAYEPPYMRATDSGGTSRTFVKYYDSGDDVYYYAVGSGWGTWPTITIDGGNVSVVAWARTGGYPAALPPPVPRACEDGLLDELEDWGGYGGGGAWGASAPDGKTLWEIVQQSVNEVRDPILLWRNLQAENPEIVEVWESYEGWFWAQYDETTDGWVLLDRNGDTVDREAVGFGGYGGGGSWGLSCDVDRDGELDPAASTPTAAPVVITVTQPPAPGNTPAPSGGCDFGITDPSSWLCSLGGLLGQLLDAIRAVLRLLFDVVRAFIPSAASFNQLGTLKDELAAKPPFSIVTTGLAAIAPVGTAYSNAASCTELPDFDPAQQGRLRLPCAPDSPIFAVGKGLVQMFLIACTVLYILGMANSALGGGRSGATVGGDD